MKTECSTPTEEQVLKAVYESRLHRYAPDVLKTRWKDGIDIDIPSAALMSFARKLLDRTSGWSVERALK